MSDPSQASIAPECTADGQSDLTATSLNIQIHEAILRTHAQSILTRPRSTSKAYSGRHVKKWFAEKSFLDGVTVTGDKLHLFLHEQVIGRGSRKRHRDDETSIRKVGKSTVVGYNAAIVDLWRQQKAMMMNNHPNPRDCNVKRLLKNAECETQQHRKANFIDRGIGTY